MDSTNTRIQELVRKLLSGQISAAEEHELNTWYNQNQDEPIHIPEEFEISEERLSARMLANIQMQMNKKFAVRLWPRIAVAAAAVTVITLGVWFYNISNTPRHLEDTRDLLNYANKIKSGRNTATLTLANGEVIDLDTNKTSVTATDSVKISTMLTASTPRGGTYQVVLPDGTKAWLNAASSIRFPSSFAGNKQRRIEMTGEVYLEVAKDKAHPFIVKSRGQEVEVLGTHFNINAYDDEKVVKTTLLEGSVRVSPSSSSSSGIVLKPAEQAILNREVLVVKPTDLQETMAWQKGYFSFYDEDITSVMRKISRWYNIDVEYSGQPSTVGFNARIDRYSNIINVLKVLEKSNAVHFKIEGRRVIVSN